MPATATRITRAELGAVILGLALFGVLGGWQLQLPGLHNDESQEAGLQAVQLLNGRPVSTFRDVGLGPRNLPLMVQDYIGASYVYLALPFMAVLGPGPIGLRVTSMAVALLVLVGTYGLTRALFGVRPALIALFLLATHPSFVFWYRQGVFIASLTTLLAVFALWVLAVWAQRGGWRWLLLLGLLVGLGIYTKLLFVWVVGGLLGALAIINLPTILRRQWDLLWPRAPTWQGLLAGALGTALGALPLLIYNLRSNGTLLAVFNNLGTSYYGVNNLAIAENLAVRWQEAREVLLGVQFWYLGGSYASPAQPAATIASLAIIGVWAWRRGAQWRWAAFLALTLVLGFAQSIFTVSGLFHTHLAIFLPLPAILIAIAAGRIPNTTYSSRLAIAAVMALLLLGNLGATVQYHQRLSELGGLGAHSDAIYRLTTRLQAEAGGPVVALDWGFAPQVRQLTGDSIQPSEIFGFEWATDRGFAARLAPFLQNHDTLYVLHWENEEIFARRADFFAEVEAAGLHSERIAIIARRDGAPLFEIVRLHPVNALPD